MSGGGANNGVLAIAGGEVGNGDIIEKHNISIGDNVPVRNVHLRVSETERVSSEEEPHMMSLLLLDTN